MSNNPNSTNDNQDLQFLNTLITSSNPIPNTSMTSEEEKNPNSQTIMPPIYTNPSPNISTDFSNENILNSETNLSNKNEGINSAEIISNPIMDIEFNLPKEEQENENIKNSKNENINKKNYQLSLSDSNQKLNEPISDSIKRDLFLIWTKLSYVINPFKSNNEKNKHIKQWDLWGPLIFTILLAITLAIRATEKGNTFILVFLIFWFGSFLIYINSHLLEVKISIFHIFCLLGYCMFPLNISSFILMLYNFYEIFRILIVVLGCFWSSFSASGFLKCSVDEENIRGLVLYPVILLYLFLAGVILMNRF